MLISDISNLVNLLSARAFCEASTKLGDNKRDTKSLSVLSSLANSLLVPFKANIGVLNLRLSSHALSA